MFGYLLFLLVLIPFIAFSAWASARVNATYSKYDRVQTRSCMTGYDTATRLMRSRGVSDIAVNRVEGKLTDHYNPSKKVVNLSMSTYGSASVAAVAVAAHEVGHGSRLALPIILVGLLLDIFWASAPHPYGEWAVYLGIALYGLSTLFMLVTLPVEFNASRRAKKMLVDEGILTPEEVPAASKVLSAAALTYVASLLISLLYFLRFALVFASLVRRD